MNFRLSSESINILDFIREGVDSLSSKLSKEIKDYDKIIEDTSIVILKTFLDKSEVTETDLSGENKPLYIFSKFLCKSCVLAYFQKLDSDKDLPTLKDKCYESKKKSIRDRITKENSDDKGKCTLSNEELEKKVSAEISSLEESGSVGKTDFMFGFDGLSRLINGCVETLKCQVIENSSVKADMESNLLAQIREGVSPEDYLTKGYADKDIYLISLLGEKSSKNYSEFVENVIKVQSNAYKLLLETATDEIMGIYKYLYQDSFGLRPYVGVGSFSSSPIRVIDNNYRYSTIPDARLTFNKVIQALKSKYEVNECQDRQFNVEDIISDGATALPRYYPKKCLEYAMGRELTYELSEGIYKPFARTDSWEDYSKGYVEPQIKELVFDTIYKTLERRFDIKEVKNSLFTSDETDKSDSLFSKLSKSKKEGTFSFNSDEFGQLLGDDEKEFILAAYLDSSQMGSVVRNNLRKLQRTVCTGIVVTKYNSLGGKTNAIKVRVVDTTGTLNKNITKTLFEGLTVGDSVEFEDGNIITEGKQYKAKSLPFDIYEFGHDFDSALSNAEPLFGYTAVELYAKRQVALSFDKILLGEDTKGTPLFASLKDADDIPMQGKLVHNMMAGSRSGKGVMTMNILASAIASNKPIFYIDRKPDMAVMFEELSEGSMFVVNGGQMEMKNDPRGVFDEVNGRAIKGWDVAYDNMPDYLKNTIFTSRHYAGDFGDYVYLRAMILCLGILLARGENAANAEILNHLGGAAGIVIVVDEFKNWQLLFEGLNFTSGGVFGNQHVFKEKDKYKKIQQNINSYKRQLEQGLESKEEAKITDKLIKAEDELKHLIEPVDIYCMSVMKKLADSIKIISGKGSAALRETELPVSDIFVIGQNIDKDPIGLDGITEMANGGYNTTTEFKTGSYFRGIFDALWHDWFMGYNQDSDKTKKYMAADSDKDVKNWITNKAYWAYVPDASIESLRTEKPSKLTYFKPYLVLNNSLEDDPNNRALITITDENGNSKQVDNPDYTFVAQCRKRVNDAVPGAELWEQVRLKHLSESAAEEARNGINKHYGELNPGIGFEGLSSATKMCAGKDKDGNVKQATPFNPVRDLGLSGDIANWVAQRLGYSNYKEYLFDFSPTGIFGVKDIADGISDPESVKNYINRLPLYYNYNINPEGNEDVDRSMEESSNNSFGFESDDNSFASMMNNQVQDEQNLGSVNQDTIVQSNPTSGSTPTSDLMNNIYSDFNNTDEESEDYYDDNNSYDEEFEDDVHTDGSYNFSIDEDEIRREAYEQGYAEAYAKTRKIAEMYAKLVLSLDPRTSGLSSDDERYIKCYTMLVNKALES